MLDLSKYKCALFDCDGVILQSNALKSAAFAEALAGEPEDLVAQFVAFHKENGGVSRYVKFEHYFKNIKGEENSQHKIDEALTSYAGIVFDQLKKVDFVSGVVSVVEYFNNRNIPCYVVSGGDQEELREVIAYRGIDHLFVDILGSPVTKNEHVSFLVQSNSMVYPSIFFGDSRSDMVAAKGNDIEFCFVSRFSEWFVDKQLIDEFFDATILDFEDVCLVEQLEI